MIKHKVFIQSIEDVDKLQMADTLRQAVAEESGHANWDEMVEAYGIYKPKENCILISDSFQQVIGKIISVYANPWINVNERLPERKGNEPYSESVIILFDDGDIMTGSYFFEEKDWGGGYSPICWMPKPALPKGFSAARRGSGDKIERVFDLVNKDLDHTNKLIKNMLNDLQKDYTDDQKEECADPKAYYAKEKLKTKNPEMAKELSTPAIEVLSKCSVSDNIVRLPVGQLERPIYVEVKNKLELIGGKWKGGKIQGFVFGEDPSEMLAQIANGEKRNLKKEFQFFGTPPHLCERLIELAEIKEGMSVLEPSAGQGAIIEAIYKAFPYYAKGPNDKGAVTIDYYELMPLNQTILSKKISQSVRWSSATSFMGEDFLNLSETSATCRYDRIIANPPFAKNQDIEHIKKMYSLLKPGGRVVSIASKHWQVSSNKKEAAFNRQRNRL